jgi:predicted double-glycine peptidase
MTIITAAKNAKESIINRAIIGAGYNNKMADTQNLTHGSASKSGTAALEAAGGARTDGKLLEEDDKADAKKPHTVCSERNIENHTDRYY